MLYVPEVNKQLFSLIAPGQRRSMSQTTKEGTIVSQNGTPFIISSPKLGKPHSFNMVLAKNPSEVPRVIIATHSGYTLWHRRMGHAHQHMIKHLGKNTEGGPHQSTKAPNGACEGCEKGKSKRLPFPTSRSRALCPLDHVHSNLDKMPVLSIGRNKYTATYLDDHPLFRVMFYLKHKNEEFAAFKTYKALAKRQLGTKLKCKHTDCGGEFMSNEPRTYLTENGIEHQTSMPDSPQQNGQAERFQQTIINGAEAMWHHTGLFNSFWIYAVKAKLHTYNVTLIKCADYKTPKELWSGQKPNISHLRVFRCLAWVHVLKKRRHKLQPKSRAMIFVGYELGSKGYQFWDAAHQCFEISHDVKFKETQFPAKELKSTKSIPAPVRNCQLPESDNESDSLGLDLVNLAQPPTRLPSPGLPASGSTPQESQSARPISPPIAPPQAPRGSNTPLPDTETALSWPLTHRYSLCFTKAQEQRQPIITQNH